MEILETDTFIEVQSGKFELGAPRFEIYDIAHALSHLCRFNGHCSKFYSVAEHSILVAYILEREFKQPVQIVWQGLMHDASEAYLSDVPSPLKVRLHDWKKFEKDLDIKIEEHYKLGKEADIVKKADWYALFIEADQLMPSKGEMFNDPHGYREEALKLEVGSLANHSIEQIREAFLGNYLLLRSQL